MREVIITSWPPKFLKVKGHFCIDPAFESLPESYFLDDRKEEGLVDSGGSESEEEGGLRSTPTPEAVDNSTTHSTVSPRAVSNSRRKRKRKTSQSEKRQLSRASTSPPPLTSPVDIPNSSLRASQSPPPTSDLDHTPRAYPSPANPASPDSITSPCSPLSALASDHQSVSIMPYSGTTANTSAITPQSGSRAPWISIDRRRKNSTSSDSLVTGKSPSTSVESLTGHSGRSQCDPTATPHKKVVLSGGQMRNETRTRLMNKFNAMSGQVGAGPGKAVYTSQKSLPMIEMPSPRGPWARLDAR